MFIIGDIHAQFKAYEYAINKLNLSQKRTPADSYNCRGPRTHLRGMDCSLQIGDFGMFTHYDFSDLEETPNHKFIRGNHDNPELCRRHPNYLGDWGYLPKNKIFFVGGGFSIDKAWRTPGLDWWEDEELSTSEFHKVIESYIEIRPKIVISHECPTIIKKSLLPVGANPTQWVSRTELALQAMFEAHKPKLWINGHYHHFKTQRVEGVKFISLGALNYDGWRPGTFIEIPGVF